MSFPVAFSPELLVSLAVSAPLVSAGERDCYGTNWNGLPGFRDVSRLEESKTNIVEEVSC
jgi:hypothetical protein